MNSYPMGTRVYCLSYMCFPPPMWCTSLPELSSLPRCNCQAEIGVKYMKIIITNNTGPHGDLNVDKFLQTILQHRNTPDRDTKLSPGMHIFGWPIRDLIPILPGKYHSPETWCSSATAREEVLRNHHMGDMERWTKHTHQIPPLKVHDHVQLQNKTGLYPSEWDKTGLVVQARQFSQYLVRMDGSGWVPSPSTGTQIDHKQWLGLSAPTPTARCGHCFPTTIIDHEWNYSYQPHPTSRSHPTFRSQPTNPHLVTQGDSWPPTKGDTYWTFWPSYPPILNLSPGEGNNFYQIHVYFTEKLYAHEKTSTLADFWGLQHEMNYLISLEHTPEGNILKNWEDIEDNNYLRSGLFTEIPYHTCSILYAFLIHVVPIC